MINCVIWVNVENEKKYTTKIHPKTKVPPHFLIFNGRNKKFRKNCLTNSKIGLWKIRPRDWQSHLA